MINHFVEYFDLLREFLEKYQRGPFGDSLFDHNNPRTVISNVAEDTI